ncbi:MAG: hypothetical protein PHP01_02465 [Phycisphaerae bacterium]|nr:hypothetical protein [Phycisphaerae bacterium]
MSRDKRKGGYIFRRVSIEIPDRGKNEDSITDNQLEYIKTLAPDFRFEGGLESLGKWQASAIITQIKEKRDDLKYNIAKHKKGSKLKKLFWLIVVIVIIYYFAKSR